MAGTGREEAQQRLLAAIDAFAENAYGSETDDELAQSRALAIERYLGKNINPAPVGRSQVRDRTTFEVVEWTKPSLLRIFTSGNEVCKFDPEGPEDEGLAEQESDYINYVLTQRNNWHAVCNDWIGDGLLLKNGYCYAYWDEHVVPESEKYENLTDDSFALLAQDKEVEIVAHEQRPNTELDERNQQAFQQATQQHQQAMQQMAMQMQMQPPQPGQPPPQPPQPPQSPQPAFLHDCELKRTKKRGQVKLCVVAPERTLVDINAKDHTLAECDYFEFFDFKTIGSLRADGLEVDDEISSSSEERRDRDGTVELARDLYNESTFDGTDSSPPDPSLRRVKVRYIWVRHDFDGDKIPEMQYVILVGSTILFREECEEIPVSSWSPIPMAHRHIGMSLADSVDDIEEINTDLIRQGINNLQLANTPRIAASDRVNMSDLLDVRVGGVIRVEGQPPQEMMPIEVPNVFPSVMNGVSFFDSRRQNRTGINAYFQGTDANALNKTASGISQLTNSAAQRVETVGRYLASAVERLFLIVHRLVLQHGHSEEVVRLRNRWVTVDPAQWRKRNDVRITVGLGTGNKDSLLQQLSMMFQTQLAAAQFGVVDPPNVYATVMEMAKAASFSTPERFATDPTTKPPPQPQPPPEVIVEQMRQQGDAQKNQMDAQMDAQKTQVNAELQTQLEQMRLAFQKWKAEFDRETELMLEQIRTQKDVALEDRRLGSAEGMKMEEYRRADREINAEDNRDQLVAEVQQQFGELQQAMQALIQNIDGRKVVGVEKVRDPRTGKMAAARVKRADGSTEEVTIQ